MAKIDRGDLDPKTFPNTRKGFYFRQQNGKTVAAKSPTFGPRNNRNSIWWRNIFTIAARMAASPLWLDFETAVNLSKGTEQVPRDILVMAAYGCLVSIEFPDGTATTISDHGPPPEINPTEDKRVLVWSQQAQAYNSTISSTAFAFKGSFFTPQLDMKCTGVTFIVTWIASGVFRGFIAEVDGSNTIISIANSPDINPTSNTLYPWRVPIVTTMLAEHRYVVMVGRVGGPANYPLRISASQNANWLGPITQTNGAQLLSNNPQIGDVITNTGSLNAIPVGLELEWS